MHLNYIWHPKTSKLKKKVIHSVLTKESFCVFPNCYCSYYHFYVCVYFWYFVHKIFTNIHLKQLQLSSCGCGRLSDMAWFLSMQATTVKPPRLDSFVYLSEHSNIHGEEASLDVKLPHTDELWWSRELWRYWRVGKVAWQGAGRLRGCCEGMRAKTGFN